MVTIYYFSQNELYIITNIIKESEIGTRDGIQIKKRKNGYYTKA